MRSEPERPCLDAEQGEFGRDHITRELVERGFYVLGGPSPSYPAPGKDGHPTEPQSRSLRRSVATPAPRPLAPPAPSPATAPSTAGPDA